VDDEAPARDELLFLLQAHPDVDAGQAKTAQEALDNILSGGVDLVFQDIQMPGEDGFAVLAGAHALEDPPLFVFVTAFDTHAIRAFEENAADYLLKPVSPDRLAKSLERVRRQLSEPKPPRLTDAIERLLSHADARSASRPLPRIAVEQGGRIGLIATGQVVLVEAGEKHVLVMTENERLVCHGMPSLARVAERLAGQPFFQANRSQIINMERIAEFAPWYGGKYCVTMADAQHTEVTVSRNRVRAFKELLGL
jgi:two-component system LytT family response regulator